VVQIGPAHTTFHPETQNRGGFFPFPPAASPVKSDRTAVARWTRSCRGGSLDQEQPVGGSWAEGVSSRRAINGGVVDDGEVVDGGADERLRERNFGSVSNRGQRGSLWYTWLGQRRMEHDGR
jgi:hypothetical protein